MAKLTAEMKDLVATQQCWIATVGADGVPNVGPKRSTRVVDDEHLAFSEGTGMLTWQNVQAGSKVAIGVANRETLRGFRFVGSAEPITAGPEYEGAAAMAKQRGLPAPKAVVRVTVERIFDLSVPGAGRELT